MFLANDTIQNLKCGIGCFNMKFEKKVEKNDSQLLVP